MDVQVLSWTTCFFRAAAYQGGQVWKRLMVGLTRLGLSIWNNGFYNTLRDEGSGLEGGSCMTEVTIESSFFSMLQFIDR